MNWMELLGLSGFEDFERIEINELKKLDQKHRSHILRAGRRVVAAVLAATMLLPASAMAAQLMFPPQADRDTTDGTSADDPSIQIESNFVHDEFGFLTNTLELAILVKSPMYDTGTTDVTTGDPIFAPRPVEAISVNLVYNTKLLHPVTWEWVRDEDAVTQNYDVETNVDKYYARKLETKKNPLVQTAAATTGIVDTAIYTKYNMSANVANKNQGLLYFTARAFEPEEFEELTRLAVIRFAVDDSLMEHIEIQKNGKDYDVYYDGTTKISDIAGLTAAMTAAATAAGASAPLPLVEFAQQSDIEDASDKARSLESTLLYYSDEFTQMHYIPGFDHVKAYAADPTVDTSVVKEVEWEIDGTKYKLKRPNTTQSPKVPTDWKEETLTLARDGSTTPVGYSYLTNLIHKDKVEFTVVSDRTFVSTGDTLGNLTTIVYVDWDNTILGTQIVPKKTDVRGLVSDYVAENFIYHDEDDSKYNAQFDLNNPEQIATARAGATPTAQDIEDVVSSLERKDNYRGKYPATAPMGLASDGSTLHDSPDTVVDEMDDPTTDVVEVQPGREYPLTNKLDYVFFKRPMQHTVSYKDSVDSNGNPLPAEPDPAAYGGADSAAYKTALAAYEKAYHDWYYGAEWSQKMTPSSGSGSGGSSGSGSGSGSGGTTPVTSTAYWDVEHPYAYGWALCTAENYEDVWTTLGMGELGSTTAVTEVGAAGTTKGYSGAILGGYRNISSTSVASVTYDGDADFAFADLEKGFTESEVFLKAIYEPGVDLMDSTNPYQLYRDPYYNKLNTAASAGGGAYNIEMLFERSAVVLATGNLVGLARMRSPAVRQDTTTDMRWESLAKKNVSNDDMINATETEAYEDKNKTTFTNVVISNDEMITVSLTLSARQNKIDYYLMDTYGGSFVAGTERALSDTTQVGRIRRDGIPTLDNYTYYVEDVNSAPYYATPRFSERAGTRGFVLSGTLDSMLEAATKRNNGLITEEKFEEYVSIDNLQDANIRVADGTEANGGNITTLRTAVKAAAAAAETAYNNGSGDAQWWDVEHDHASLTYHQLQHYIMGDGLIADAANELEGGATLTWCRVHDACAALTSDKPDTWEKLMAAAKETGTTGKDKITKLTPTQIESYFKLRGPNAALWTATTVDTFANGVIAAVGLGADSWDEVQYYLINNSLSTTADTVGASNYWWYDCIDSSTTYTISDFSGLLTAAKDAWTDVAMVDGRNVKRTAKLNQLKKAYDDNYAVAMVSGTATGDTDSKWVAATENLCVNNNGEPFASLDDFNTALADALDTLNTAGYSTPDWWQVQYVILHAAAIAAGTDTVPLPYDSNLPAGALKTEYDGYWWHNGGVNISDLETLLKAAQKPTVWAGVDFNTFDGLNLHFAADLKGTAITATNYAAVKSAIAAYANMSSVDKTNAAWDSVQYTIIHNGTFSDLYRDAEKTYYWWKSGATTPPTTPFTFAPSGSTAEAKANSMAELLSEAYFKINYNGYNATAWNTLTETDLATGRLVKSQTSGATAFTALGQLTAADVTTVVGKLGTLFDAVNGTGTITPYPSPIPTKPYTPIDWTAIQAAILGDTTANPTYWWKKADTKANDPDVDFRALRDAIQAYATSRSATDLAALRAAFTADKVKNMGFVRTSTPSVVDVPAATINNINNRWLAIISASTAASLNTTPVKWDQIELLCLNAISNTYRILPSAASTTQVTARNITRPAWVTAGGYSLRPMMSMGMLAPDALEEQAAEVKDLLSSLVSTLAEDPALAAKLAEDPDYKDILASLAGAAGCEMTEKTEGKAPSGTYDLEDDVKLHLPEQGTGDTVTNGENKTENTENGTEIYDLDDDVKVYLPEEKTGETVANTGTKTNTATSTNTKTDSETKTNTVSAPAEAAAQTGKTTTTDKKEEDAEQTGSATEKAEADLPTSTDPPQSETGGEQSDDKDSLSATDPPGNIIGIATGGGGTARFRASPQRSPEIRFLETSLLPTLTNRRITA